MVGTAGLVTQPAQVLIWAEYSPAQPVTVLRSMPFSASLRMSTTQTTLSPLSISRPRFEPAATQIPLWQQLQGAASLLMAVRDGQSLTAALEEVDAALRPGVQALGFHTLRWLGRAEALRQQLAKRPPPPEADALLCVALALAWNIAPALVPERANFPQEAHPSGNFDVLYSAHTLVDQAVEAAKRSEGTRHQASFINGCLRAFLRDQPALVAKTDSNPQAIWNHPQWWVDRVRKD